MMCRIHYDLDTTLEFDIKVKFIVFDMFSCLVHNFFGLTYLTIFGTWVYHHDALCRKHSWTPYDHDLWPQGLIYRLLSCLHVWPVTSVFWHWHTIFGIWVYHHERMCQVHSSSWYDVDLWPQGQIYMVYDMALCSGLSFFVLWNSHTLFGTWVYHHDTMCRIHSCTLYDLDHWPQYQNYIFTMDVNLARCLCFLTYAYQIWQMAVSPLDNMLWTFLTLVWPWPLTYMWVAGVSLESFISCFYLVLFWCEVQDLYFVT